MRPMTPLFRNLFRKRRVEQDLNDEIRTCVEMATDERVGRGLAPAEARRQALVEFGGAEQVKEQVRAVRAGALIEHLGQDSRLHGGGGADHRFRHRSQLQHLLGI